MSTRTIYLSCVPEEWEATRGLRDALGAASLTVVARQPDRIATAWRFVACFAPGPNGTSRYDRDELLAALETPRFDHGETWLFALKLQPCQLPVYCRDLPVLEATSDWAAVVEQIVGYTLRARATASVRSESVMAVRDVNITGAELSNGTTPSMDAHLDAEIGDVVAKRDVNLTALRSHDPRRKGR